jgi:ribosomal protein L29
MSKTLPSQLEKLKLELAKTRLEIKTGKNKNTNAHKKLKKQIAQLLSQKKQEK